MNNNGRRVENRRRRGWGRRGVNVQEIIFVFVI